MSPPKPTQPARLGFAVVDPPSFDGDLIEALSLARITVTFFVRPEVLVVDSVRWRFVRAAGHELGNGCLLGVTDDGRLPNWTCATLEAELQDCAKLLRDMGQPHVVSVFLPGKMHVCADGRYRHKLQRAFGVCVGETERSASLQGKHGAFDIVAEPGRPSGRPAVILIRPDAPELRRLAAAAGAWTVSPVSDLVIGNPHT
ncbi:MAG: hypothetical protein ACYC96_13430 [Fimbriimonadaceae bacterium]